MPPKAASTPSKDDAAAKELKDLQFLLTCIKASPNVIHVDYEALAEELKKQGLDLNNAAVRKRVQRMAKALDIKTKGATGAATSGDATPEARPAAKKRAAGKKVATNGSKDDEETEQTPSKKQKVGIDGSNAKDDEEE